MKRNLHKERTESGQALFLFFLFFIAVVVMLFSLSYVKKMRMKPQSARIENTELRDTIVIKKAFPYNRYSNEVLMY